MFSTGWPSARCTRLVNRPSRPAHSSTSLKCASGWPSRIGLPSAPRDRRAVGVVEHALDEVAGGQQVLQALLVLDADGVAAELVGDARGGDVHLALVEDLVAR